MVFVQAQRYLSGGFVIFLEIWRWRSDTESNPGSTTAQNDGHIDSASTRPVLDFRGWQFSRTVWANHGSRVK